jgi:putative ABC transport system permease protein
MNTSDILKETYTSLASNKVRTGLTMLGIVIGISSVIAMIAIGNGAQATIQSNIESLGSNLLVIMPGAQRGPGVQVNSARGSAKTLTIGDVSALEALDGAKAVAPEVSGRYQVTAKGTNTNTSVNGVTSAYADVRNVSVSEGDFISDSSVATGARIAVVGPTVVTDLFPDGEDPVGQTIRIKGMIFTIVGVTTAKGGSGFGSQDDVIFVPMSTAQRYLSGDNYVSTISVQATSQETMTALQADATATLLDRHNSKDVTSADFNILNQADIVSTASSVTSTFTLLLGAVAGISLLVGGIGIMNMMLTTVTERTREIGLRKAIGAKRNDINKQFLIEAVVLTVTSGTIGIMLGCLIAYAVTKLGVIQTSVSLTSVLLAFGVSAVIGIVFGYYPARRASRLHPIDALRYE